MSSSLRNIKTIKLFLLIFSLTLTRCAIQNNESRLSSTENHSLETKVREKRYKNFYVLGDSLSDSGALIGTFNSVLAVIKEEVPCLWIKKIYFSPLFYKGRSFSDGPLAVEYVAAKLGLPMKPGWSFQVTPALKQWVLEQTAEKLSMSPQECVQKGYRGNMQYILRDQVGTNYAVANARASFDSSLPYFLYFNQFQLKNQLNSLVRHHPDIGADDLLFIMIGGNDIMAAVFDQSPSKVIDKSISEIESALNMLVAKNVQHIVIANAPDIGLIPAFVHTERQEIATQLTQNFNQKLKNTIESFANKYPKIDIKIFQLGDVFKNLLSDYKKKGYTIDQACISDIANKQDLMTLLDLFFTGELIATYNCGCSRTKIDSYLFFDSFHPAKFPHQFTGESLYNLIIK